MGAGIVSDIVVCSDFAAGKPAGHGVVWGRQESVAEFSILSGKGYMLCEKML
jgi:hypothetical protein